MSGIIKKQLKRFSGVDVNLFIFGLSLHFLLLFLAPNKPFYFFSFFLTYFIFLNYFKSIAKALVFVVILAIFSDISLGAAFFRLEPASLNMGSGWWISSLTVFVPFLALVSYKKRLRKFETADLALFAFFVWSGISFYVNISHNSFIGLIQLFEMAALYYLLRLNLSEKDLPQVRILLIFMLLFQSLIALLQFFFRHPLGLVLESVLFYNPAGITAVENINLFRVTAAFGHPNAFAAFLLSVFPLLLHYPHKSQWMTLAKIMVLLVLIFTFSRIAWIVLITVYLLLIPISPFSRNYYWFKKKAWLNKKVLISAVALFFSLYILSPYFFSRVNTSPVSLDEFGSMGIRVKLDIEAFNLISKNYIFGTGLNRSLETYALYPVTNIFESEQPGAFYKIHNTFLEIASETGLPGLLLFLLFLGSVVRNMQKRTETDDIGLAVYAGLLGLIVISYVNPFFHTGQMKTLFLLIVMLLVYNKPQYET
ncbi:MAG: hypothetical protein UV73_C0002G0126 [Candidatus Gottesmanbacteria bacterium GW2011_GWA2_43_14]|uniref:O-antigen ligase-related domain-containing protein n=1 Tax=Candidatus Gottesmanbacteria bacterium GW2011_GWA2_43_14 TaxID=1618443 RepID=A0A0G1DLE3_9BACT|nr:MAG: hypothetical protein UV73_C0002G0126 [Candidatus Gottesmanbacteria bacterium GW2011_GWA2_43_14]